MSRFISSSTYWSDNSSLLETKEEKRAYGVRFCLFDGISVGYNLIFAVTEFFFFLWRCL